MVFPKQDGKMQALSGVNVLKAQHEQWKSVRNHGKLKARIRKGIPQSLRGTIWQNLCGARERQLASQETGSGMDSYSALKNRKESPHHEQIWKDINRTYRKHARFDGWVACFAFAFALLALLSCFPLRWIGLILLGCLLFLFVFAFFLYAFMLSRRRKPIILSYVLSVANCRIEN